MHIGGVMRQLCEWPARILFPPTCLGCRNIVEQPGTLCPDCWPQVRFIERPWCEVMGTPFAHDMGEGMLSAEAIADPPPFVRARSAVLYQGVPQRMARALKFGDRTDLAPWMARWMVRAGAELIADADAIVPVPLHRYRFLSRRFNQSAELSRAIARQTGLPHLPGVLVRRKATRPQVGLTAPERRANLDGVFTVPERCLPLVRDRRLILVDDVYTTGTTVKAATRVLLRAGAAAVDVLTFARVLPEDFAIASREHI
ncbi:ComF family protein [Chelativorans composti]|jgi:Predicted amidophosphoribosyltransferases|uniref:ComF family protein n=1 Tax=Chelativorans composti TaxID=768533 RepID=A0ABW5DHC7_9HYPH